MDSSPVAGVDAHYYYELATAAVVNLKDSINIILQCCDKYRLPEPARRADKLARIS